jgi:hypothetical protein
VPEGLYADAQCGEHVDVSHRPVNDDPLPPVGQSLGSQLIAQERTSQRPASVNDQHLALTISHYELPDPGVVFVAFDGGDGAPELRNPTVAAKHRIGDLQNRCVLVAEIARRFVQTAHEHPTRCVMHVEDGSTGAGQAIA